jgi:predicted tellurium resistance membrane protein TerC
LRDKARFLGIGLALVMRLVLLAAIGWIMSLTTPLFTVMEYAFSAKDLLMLLGGLFLLVQSTRHIHDEMDPDVNAHAPDHKPTSMRSAIIQILFVDAVFSLDSLLSAIGLTEHIWVIAVAIIVSIGVMVWLSGPILRLIERQPSLKVLAMSFVMLIGALMVAESMGYHVPRGYIYFAMAFSTCVELVNIRIRKRRKSLKA